MTPRIRTFYLASIALVTAVGLAWLLSLCVSTLTAAAPQPDPTMITVDTTEDELNMDGDCSLREAIQAANLDVAVDACASGSGTDRIIVPAGFYTLQITGTRELYNNTGDLNIRSDLSLIGASITETVLDGNRIDRMLHIAENLHVDIADLTITNGRSADGTEEGCGPGWDSPCDASDGGAIYNEGLLTMTRVVVQDSAAGNGGDWENYTPVPVRGGHGGGIFNAGSLHLFQSRIQRNQAGTGLPSYETCGAGLGGEGGGIFNMGQLTLQQTTVSHNLGGTTNHATCGPGAIGDDGTRGGGIFNSGQIAMSRSTIYANSTAAGGGGGGSHGIGGDGGNGGGIYNTGHIHLESSTVSSNHTGRGGGGSRSGEPGKGAGIFNSGALTLTNSTVAANQTGSFGTVPLGLRSDEPGEGGGIYNSGRAILYSTLVGANDAPGFGNDCAGYIHSLDYNLFATLDGFTLTGKLTHTLVDVAPHVAPLADNGGDTWTQGLRTNSPAIDHGSCTDIHGAPIHFDQRGAPRPLGSACDIGAYEADIHTIYTPIIWR